MRNNALLTNFVLSLFLLKVTSGLHVPKQSQQDIVLCRLNLSSELLTICERKALPRVVSGHGVFSAWLETS